MTKLKTRQLLIAAREHVEAIDEILVELSDWYATAENYEPAAVIGDDLLVSGGATNDLLNRIRRMRNKLLPKPKVKGRK